LWTAHLIVSRCRNNPRPPKDFHHSACALLVLAGGYHEAGPDAGGELQAKQRAGGPGERRTGFLAKACPKQLTSRIEAIAASIIRYSRGIIPRLIGGLLYTFGTTLHGTRGNGLYPLFIFGSWTVIPLRGPFNISSCGLIHTIAVRSTR
jgi:hypothetical protein